MIRLLGIGMIAAATVAFGVSYSFSLRQEYRCFHAFVKLARYIRARIACFCQPLSEIYDEFSDPTLDACGFLAELRQNGLTAALCRKKTALGLRQELFSLLADFGEGLGSSFAEEQLRHCDRCLSLMEEALASLEKELPVRTRLVRTLAVASAAMAVILLL